MTRQGDILDHLDEQIPSTFYWKLTLLATVGGFLFGYDTSNIGSALNFIPYHLSGFWTGYLVAGASLGAAVGALCAGPLVDRFGRKALLIADAAIYAAGAILSAVTPDAPLLLIARTLIGLGIGADTAVATAYIAEYAPKRRRGALSMLQQWMITVGILGAYLVALIILRVAPGSAGDVDWRLMLGLGAVPALLGLVFRTTMPESPRWLLRKGQKDRARAALKTFGIEASTRQLDAARQRVEAAERRQERARSSAWTPGVKRAVVVVSIFFIFQQITGINVPLYYGPHLLGPIFETGKVTKVVSTTAGVEVTAIMTVVNVAATYFGFRFIDRVGRRAISICGYAGMIVAALVAAAGLGFLHGTPRIVLVMVGLDLFIASFAVGVGGTGWTLQGEVFPTAVRGQAAAIAATADWLANFALVEAFPVWNSTIGLSWVLVCFGALALVAIVFVQRFLPETRGLSVEEITTLFEEHQLTAQRRRRPPPQARSYAG